LHVWACLVYLFDLVWHSWWLERLSPSWLWNFSYSTIYVSCTYVFLMFYLDYELKIWLCFLAAEIFTIWFLLITHNIDVELAFYSFADFVIIYACVVWVLCSDYWEVYWIRVREITKCRKKYRKFLRRGRVFLTKKQYWLKQKNRYLYMYFFKPIFWDRWMLFKNNILKNKIYWWWVMLICYVSIPIGFCYMLI